VEDIMNDHDFLAAFEAGKLANDEFRHRDHIRMAWLYLHRDGWQIGVKHIEQGIQRFAGLHHVPLLYHETITVFWAHLVMYAIQQTPDLDNFTAFEDAHPHLFDSGLIHTYFSREILSTDAARRTMADPDVKPLPE
jgi:hypothetical protein